MDEQFRLFKENSSLYSDPNNNEKEPFINTLFREHVQRPKELPMDCVRDEVNTFMSAGHDTIGWTLTYALFLVGHHPEVQAKVHEEVDNFFSKFESEDDITVDSLRELKYIDAIIKETLRLFSPIPMISRKASSDIKIGKHVIPRGSEVILGIKTLHRDPQYWNEPLKCKPERFLEGKLCHPYVFIPFSAGARNCIGQRYATVVVKSMFSFIMRRYTIKSLDSIDLIQNLTIGAPIAVSTLPIRMHFANREI